jgi:hypothetical protein
MNQNVYGTQHHDSPPAAYIPREMFSVGEVLGTGIKIWLKNFFSYVALTGMCYLPLFIYAVAKLGSGSNLTISKLQSMQTVSIVVAVASLVLNFVAAGAVTYGVVIYVAPRLVSASALRPVSDVFCLQLERRSLRHSVFALALLPL